MAQIDDERAIREVMAEMTQDQPPAPPARYAAIRRRAIAHRRRQLAGAVAAVAILVAAAIAIPLGLLRIGPPPPVTPSRHYHVTENRPGRGSGGLIAYGTVDGTRWKIGVTTQPQLSDGFCMNTESGPNPSSCVADLPETADDAGSPAMFSLETGWGKYTANLGTVASDVSYLKVGFSNGQVLTLYPVAIYGPAYARFVALMTPYDSAVTSVTAYSSHGELGYAIPFTALPGIGLNRWLRPGQLALPRPVTYLIGSGTVNGTAWQEHAWIGPWGTCVGGAGGGSACYAQTGSVLSAHQIVTSFGLSVGPGNTYFVYGQAKPSVSYLIVTRSDGSTERVSMTRAGAVSFYAYASVRGHRVVRWAAYGAHGQRLASGTGWEP
jgi:hypothetical protein